MSRRSSRRKFVWEAALCAAAATASKLHASPSLDRLPIVDCHIHLFDPGRPGGVPWPTPDDTVLYRPALPERYRALTRDQGVIAAIAVECSPLPSDNDWLLKTAASSDVVVGVIGDLDPARKEFTAQLERLATHPLFLGIRYGNLWHRDLGQHLDDPLFLANLKTFARHGLVFESANPNPKLVADLLRLASNIPDLRIVIDHLPQALPPQDRVQRAQYLATLKQLSERPNVFVKGSEILRVWRARFRSRSRRTRPGSTPSGRCSAKIACFSAATGPTAIRCHPSPMSLRWREVTSRRKARPPSESTSFEIQLRRTDGLPAIKTSGLRRHNDCDAQRTPCESSAAAAAQSVWKTSSMVVHQSPCLRSSKGSCMGS